MPNWTYIYFLPAAVSFFWPAVIMLRKRRINNAQWLMCLTMMMVTLSTLAYMAWFRGRQEALYAYDMIFMWSSALAVPTFYMFICALTNPHGISLANRQLFLPPLIYCTFLLILAISMGSSGYAEYVTETKTLGCPLFEEGNTAKNLMIIFSHYGYPIFFAVGLCIIIILAAVKGHRFHERFNRYYADRVNQPKLSDKPLLITSFIIIPLAGAFSFVSYAHPNDYMILNIVIVLVVTMLQFMNGLYTFRLSYTAADLAREQRDDILREEVKERKKITVI